MGKPPDWALEVASASTGRDDVNRKPAIYAAIGILEYWCFDPSGGRHHGARLWGGRLVGGRYVAIELTTEPDGILKGYSDVLELSLAWDEGWPRLYDPATGTYLENWREEREARRAAEAEKCAAPRTTAPLSIRKLGQEVRRVTTALSREGRDDYDYPGNRRQDDSLPTAKKGD